MDFNSCLDSSSWSENEFPSFPQLALSIRQSGQDDVLNSANILLQNLRPAFFKVAAEEFMFILYFLSYNPV